MPQAKKDLVQERDRSPHFPSIDVSEAIEKAAAIYKEDRRHPTDYAILMTHMGYGSKSSGGKQSIAALRKYGLLERLEDGRYRLTDSAARIVLDERPASAERLKLIQEAALRPEQHKVIWDRYGPSLPSDSTLKFHLVSELGFTDTGARDFLAQFRKTIAFAKIGDSGTMGSEPEDETPVSLAVSEDQAMTSAPATPIEQARPQEKARPIGAQLILARLTMSGSNVVEITAAQKLTEDDLDRLKRFLDLMGPTWVAGASG